MENLQTGRYEVCVKYEWVDFSVKDYTLRVYAEEPIVITDASDNTSMST